MGGYRAHLSFSTCVFFLLLIIFFAKSGPSLLLVGELFCVTLLGSLFPDVDIKSKGQKFMYTALFICMIPSIIQGNFMLVALILWISLIPMMVRHRGIFHDPLYVTFFISCIWYVLSIYRNDFAQKIFLHTIFFIIGAQSHLLLDYGLAYYAKKLFRFPIKKRWRGKRG